MTEPKTTETALREALKELLGLTGTIEVLGEWEAEDRNPKLRMKNRALVNFCIDKVRAALSLPETPVRVEYRTWGAVRGQWKSVRSGRRIQRLLADGHRVEVRAVSFAATPWVPVEGEKK